jgi:D-amino-acid dehydrogenase
MSDNRFDVLVLGAGMVGSATAAQLALRGRKVALVDREGPAAGTSYGNAGVIDSGAFIPVAFPRHLPTLLKFALGRTPHLNFHPGHLPSIAGWLFRYWRASTPDMIAKAAARVAPLAALAVAEHDRLASAAGSSALIRHTGWMHVYRTGESFAADAQERELMARYGVALEVLDEAGIAAAEPHLKPLARKAVLIKDSSSTSDPGELTKSYAALVPASGGRLVQGDAKGLMRRGGTWALATEQGVIEADQVVIALGPWARDLLLGFGIDAPIVVKRGYHMHFRAEGNATLSRPVSDPDGGYCITPMTKGVRMTTGAEFAHRDAAATPVQVERAEAMARELFPLSQRVEPAPWLGRRPMTPDGPPIIGPAPGQPGMWLAIGHGHWGLALGAATGRLLADLVEGNTPVVDPKPLGIERFGA